MHGKLILDSTLSFHLNPIEHTTKIKSSAVSIKSAMYTEHEYQALPSFCLDGKFAVVPKNWQLSSSEKKYLDSINIIKL